MGAALPIRPSRRCAMPDPFGLTSNEILALLFFFLVWPPLVTVLVCGIAGWLIPRIHWLVGVGLGLLMGAANIPLSALGAKLVNDLELVRGGSEMDFWSFILALQLVFILLGASIPVVGMWWWSRREQQSG